MYSGNYEAGVDLAVGLVAQQYFQTLRVNNRCDTQQATFT